MEIKHEGTHHMKVKKTTLELLKEVKLIMSYKHKKELTIDEAIADFIKEFKGKIIN